MKPRERSKVCRTPLPIQRLEGADRQKLLIRYPEFFP